MKQKNFSTLSMLMVAALLAACSPQSKAAAAAEDFNSLQESLRAAGAAVEVGDPIDQPFFTVKGQGLKVNGADVQVFEYESAEAMEAEAALVAPDGGSVGASMMMWMATPHFFKSGRMLILYVGDDSATLDLLKSILGEQFAGK